MDPASFIMDYEQGNLDHEDIVQGFQMLLTTGTIYHLQGSYQRAAQQMIDQGLIS